VRRKLQHILTGWLRKLRIIDVTPAEQALSRLRLSICAGCPKHVRSDVLRIVNGSGEYINEMKCTVCKCPCEPKALVVSESCPENYW
jgi:hypothetical protein